MMVRFILTTTISTKTRMESHTKPLVKTMKVHLYLLAVLLKTKRTFQLIGLSTLDKSSNLLRCLSLTRNHLKLKTTNLQAVQKLNRSFTSQILSFTQESSIVSAQ